MKTFISFALVVAGFFCTTGIAYSQKSGKPLKTKADSISYAFGIEMAKELKDNIEVEDEIFMLKTFIKGFTAYFEGDDLRMDKDSTRSILSAYFMEKSEKDKQMAIKEGNDFLEKNKEREGVSVTESGLQYEVIDSGTGKMPGESSNVTVHYKGSLIDGTEFDNSWDRGEPASFGVTQVIMGWTEALQLMHVGDRWKIYIPYELGYGERGAGGVIPPYAVLIFEVELLDVD